MATSIDGNMLSYPIHQGQMDIKHGLYDQNPGYLFQKAIANIYKEQTCQWLALYVFLEKLRILSWNVSGFL